MSDIITTTIGFLISPIVLIPCCFVGASSLSFLKTTGFGAATGLFGGLFSYPLYHFFFVSNPILKGESDHVLLIVGFSGVLAGAIVSVLMHFVARKLKSTAKNVDYNTTA